MIPEIGQIARGFKMMSKLNCFYIEAVMLTAFCMIYDIEYYGAYPATIGFPIIIFLWALVHGCLFASLLKIDFCKIKRYLSEPAPMHSETCFFCATTSLTGWEKTDCDCCDKYKNDRKRQISYLPGKLYDRKTMRVVSWIYSAITVAIVYLSSWRSVISKNHLIFSIMILICSGLLLRVLFGERFNLYYCCHTVIFLCTMFPLYILCIYALDWSYLSFSPVMFFSIASSHIIHVNSRVRV